MNTFKIKWSELAKSNLRDIHDYIKYKKQSPQVASIVKKLFWMMLNLLKLILRDTHLNFTSTLLHTKIIDSKLLKVGSKSSTVFKISMLE
jgi:hypothetical protein